MKWTVKLFDGRIIHRDALPTGVDYSNAIDPNQVAVFAVAGWETTEAPLAYRKRTMQSYGGRTGQMVCHIMVFKDKIVWVFEDEARTVIVGPTFGDQEPFGKIEPVSEQERAAIAHHLDQTPRKMRFAHGMR